MYSNYIFSYFLYLKLHHFFVWKLVLVEVFFTHSFIFTCDTKSPQTLRPLGSMSHSMGYCLFSITLSCTASRVFIYSSYSTTTLTSLQHLLTSCFTSEFIAWHCFSLTSSLIFTELLTSVTHFPSHPFFSIYYYRSPVGSLAQGPLHSPV